MSVYLIASNVQGDTRTASAELNYLSVPILTARPTSNHLSFLVQAVSWRQVILGGGTGLTSEGDAKELLVCTAAPHSRFRKPALMYAPPKHLNDSDLPALIAGAGGAANAQSLLDITDRTMRRWLAAGSVPLAALRLLWYASPAARGSGRRPGPRTHPAHPPSRSAGTRECGVTRADRRSRRASRHAGAAAQ